MNIVKLEDKDTILKVNLLGGSMVSFFDKSRNEELLWQGDERYWKYQDVVIFPILGKPEGGFTAKGKLCDFDMPHGLARHEKFKIISQSDDELLIEIVADERTLEMFPYNYKLQLRYKIENRSFSLSYIISNLDDEEMPFQVGAHAGMNLTDGINKIEFEKEEVVKRFYYRGGKCEDESSVLFTTKEFDLTPEIYAREGSLVLDRISGDTVTLVRSDGLRLKYNIGDSKAMTIWALNNGGRFACVEPWWGLCETDSSGMDLSEKALVNFVRKDPVTFTYSCQVIGK